jgi:NADPH:quinone reductase-like Zn-dependent oxidoreductase
LHFWPRYGWNQLNFFNRNPFAVKGIDHHLAQAERPTFVATFPHLMKAAITTRYGPPEVLQIMDVRRPEPKDKEVLVKVYATTVTQGDCEMRRYDMPFFLWLPMRFVMGLRKPRINILGQELAGVVEAVGKSVTHLKVGDAVFGPTDINLGSYAEYNAVPAKLMVTFDQAKITYAEVACIPTGGLNALHFVRKAGIRGGEHVLVNGAGGSIGTCAVQLIKALGATVTAVDSTPKLDMLREIGADAVVDYTREDVTQRGHKYDVIFDVWGKRVAPRFIKALKPAGRYVTANPSLSGMLYGIAVSLTSKKKVLTGLAPYSRDNLTYLCDLTESGRLKAVIDKTFRLDNIIAAHRYVETGRKAGNVVIQV